MKKHLRESVKGKWEIKRIFFSVIVAKNVLNVLIFISLL